VATQNDVRKAKIRLYAEIGVVIVVIIASLGNITVTTDLLNDPQARPNAFTGTDGDELKEDIMEEIQEIKEEAKACRRDYYEHKHEAPPKWVLERLESINTRLEKLESQVFHLYGIESPHQPHSE